MKGYLRNILIGLDQFAHALVGGYADETFSARAHREQWWVRHLINAVFFDRDHCKKAWESEKARKHLPEGY